MLEKKITHIPIIDTLRGIAALSVCILHLIVNPAGFIKNHYIINIARLGHYGVNIFFIISGIVIPLAMINMNYTFSKIGKFLAKRFVRIEPPYIVAVILGVVYFNLRNYLGGSAKIDVSPSFRDVLLHIGYLIPFVRDAKWIIVVFWTLAIEFQYYLFLALLFPLALNFNMWRFGFYLLIFLLPFCNLNPGFFPYWSTYFSIGIFYSLFISGKISRVDFFILLLIAIVIVYFKQDIGDFIVGIATLVVIHFFAHLKNAVGIKLGQISYSIYLIHCLVGVPFINILSHKVSSPFAKSIVFLSALALTIAFAYYFYRFVEKPCHEFSKRIKTPVKEQQ